MKNRLYLSPPHLSGRELDFINQAIESNWIAPLGPMVDGFESDMCTYTGAQYAAALSSGTAAMHLALLILGVKSGDEVLCSSFTFAGSCFPINYCNASPVFIDSEADSWNMDPTLLDTALADRIKNGRKPKAVIVVHLYGQTANLDSIISICNKHDVTLIEDAAESLGGLYKSKHTGTFARFGILSFNGNKIITTSGGGMLLGTSKDDIAKARFLATQARDPAPYYEHTQIGYNYRMSNIVAAIGRGQLATIEERVAKRRSIFNRYVERLSNLPGISFMPEPQWSRSNRWLTCMLIDPAKTKVTPEQVRLALEAQNIESRPLWKPMHLQPVYKSCVSYVNGVSEMLFKTGLCLPSGTAMTDADQDRVINCIRSAMGV